MDETRQPGGLIVGIVRTFLTGPLSILVIILAACAGIMAVLVTPREEEPQIVVPMADIAVSFPGHSPQEVEQLVTVPLERLLWQIDGVEHVYSISRREQGFVAVRFYVGEDRERAMVRVRDKLEANRDIVPPGVTGWIVKPVEIDDVPIVSLTLYSEKLQPHELRRIADEMKGRLARVENLSRTEVLGGYRRQVIVEADVEDMAARGITLQDIVGALQRSNVTASVGTVYKDDKTARLLVGHLLRSADEVRQTVLRDRRGRIVRIDDVAKVTDGPE